VGTSFSADGWGAGSIDAYREHWNGSGGDSDTTKTGSFYALKMYNASASGYVQQNLDLGKFRGRTITLGVWCKTSTSDAARTKINTEPSAGDVWSDYHTGGDGWEWIETTMTVGASETTLDIQLRTEVAATVYWSQPILSLGSAIGEGNYSRPSGEIVYLENQYWRLTDYTNATKSSGDDVAINLEAQSDGKLPKGIAAIQVHCSGEDSAVVDGTGFTLRKSVTTNYGLYLAPQVSNLRKYDIGWVTCGSSGDIYFQSEASGTNTLANVSIAPLAVQLR